MARRGRGLVVVGGGVVLAVASPLAYTLGSADVGNAVSASIIAATAVGAFALPLWSSRADRSEPEAADDPAGAAAVRTGRAVASGGGDASSGVRVAGGVRGRLLAMGTGRAVARGGGSSANSGVDVRAEGTEHRAGGAASREDGS